MNDAERRLRTRTRWIDGSIRSKGLVAVFAPGATLALVLAATFSFTQNTVVRAIDISVVVLALVGGLLLWHSFSTGVVNRLRRLEQDTGDIEDAGTPGHLPPGRDEIGRLAARLDKAAIQVRQHVEERDRARLRT
ncbi:MAG: hypothetical protein ACYDD6_12300, partial [Acidimicrobiales bacterium]